MNELFDKIKEHIGKIEASLELTKDTLGSIKVELNNITEIIYQSWLQEQKNKPHNQQINSDRATITPSKLAKRIKKTGEKIILD